MKGGKSVEDKQIIDMLFERDGNSITCIKDKYGKLCSSLANGILKNTSDADECVNSSYFKLWNAIPPARPSSLCAYLCKIVRNTAINIQKKNSRHNEVIYDELDEIIADNSPDNILDSDLISGLINEFLSTASKKSRQAFVLRYFFQYEFSEISQKTGMSENAVRTSLTRTKEKLREYLKEKGGLTV